MSMLYGSPNSKVIDRAVNPFRQGEPSPLLYTACGRVAQILGVHPELADLTTVKKLPFQVIRAGEKIAKLSVQNPSWGVDKLLGQIESTLAKEMFLEERVGEAARAIPAVFSNGLRPIGLAKISEGHCSMQINGKKVTEMSEAELAAAIADAELNPHFALTLIRDLVAIGFRHDRAGTEFRTAVEFSHPELVKLEGEKRYMELPEEARQGLLKEAVGLGAEQIIDAHRKLDETVRQQALAPVQTGTQLDKPAPAPYANLPVAVKVYGKDVRTLGQAELIAVVAEAASRGLDAKVFAKFVEDLRAVRPERIREEYRNGFDVIDLREMSVELIELRPSKPPVDTGLVKQRYTEKFLAALEGLGARQIVTAIGIAGRQIKLLSPELLEKVITGLTLFQQRSLMNQVEDPETLVYLLQYSGLVRDQKSIRLVSASTLARAFMVEKGNEMAVVESLLAVLPPEKIASIFKIVVHETHRAESNVIMAEQAIRNKFRSRGIEATKRVIHDKGSKMLGKAWKRQGLIDEEAIRLIEALEQYLSVAEIQKIMETIEPSQRLFFMSTLLAFIYKNIDNIEAEKFIAALSDMIPPDRLERIVTNENGERNEELWDIWLDSKPDEVVEDMFGYSGLKEWQRWEK
ncbi:hypothetical protein ACFL1W_01530 [Candidatus Margulisiibacteriota bacterium]